MDEATKRSDRPAWTAMRKRPPGARTDERGLTTLEWLLIVAAVAGLAALAVVLVQNVVGDTSEQIAGSSARETAAKIAATTIVEEANQDAGEQPTDAKTFDKWSTYYTNKCRRLAITYGDVGITVQSHFKYKKGTANTSTVSDAVEADDIYAGNVNWPLKADGTANENVDKVDGLFVFVLEAAATAGKAHAECIIF